MGQRLNLEIARNGEVLANAYYHWSAYTRSALEVTSNVLEWIENHPIDNADSANWVQVAVDILCSTRAGVNEVEKIRINTTNQDELKDLHYNDAIDRNEGLIAVTKEGIEDTRYWAEGTVVVDVGSMTVSFNVYDWFSEDGYDMFRKEFPEENYPAIKDLPEVNIDMDSIPVSDFENFADVVRDFVWDHQLFVRYDDKVVSWII